jgi:hypothetical protein
MYIPITLVEGIITSSAASWKELGVTVDKKGRPIFRRDIPVAVIKVGTQTPSPYSFR